MTSAWRCSGAGNDFLALVDPDHDPDPDRVRAWCRRGLSFGADGLFVLRRRGDDVGMKHYNADGGLAELCLNGTRCAAQLAEALGWGAETRLLTGAGPIVARRIDERTAWVEVAPPEEEPRFIELRHEGQRIAASLVRVGVPHLVLVSSSDLADRPVSELGSILRSHPDLGPEGANVHFVRTAGPRRLEIRSYERGVEAETLACGTGVLAAVAVALADDRITLPATALTAGGFELEVDGEAVDGRVRGWSLSGDARVLGRIEIRAEAAWMPPPTDWI